MDAAHFVWGAFPRYLWWVARVFLRPPCGRARFNVLGALNPVTRPVHLFTNQTYINAASVCALLSQAGSVFLWCAAPGQRPGQLADRRSAPHSGLDGYVYCANRKYCSALVKGTVAEYQSPLVMTGRPRSVQ